jgi:hypothetical protein
MIIYLVLSRYSDDEGSWENPIKAFKNKEDADNFELNCSLDPERTTEFVVRELEYVEVVE